MSSCSVLLQCHSTGQEATMAKEHCRLNIGKFLFSQIILNEWNILSADCMEASSVNMKDGDPIRR